jgi:ferredoxin
MRWIYMAFKIEITDDCIGCSQCVNHCDNYEVTDGKAHPKNAQVDEIGCNQKAADECPVKCIHITEV